LNDRIPFRVKPMLATLVRKPVHAPGWVYEEKYDGDRILAYKEGDRIHLLTRNDKEHSARLPQIVAAIQALRPRTLLLDGEMVIFDRKKVSRFQLLQQSKGEAVYAVFDCLYVDGKDLRKEPMAARRKALEEVMGADGKNEALMISRRLADNGLKAFEVAKRRGFEGLVAKDLASPYVEKRSASWLKVKVSQEDEFVIAGFTQPTGSREYIGALLLGVHEKGQLKYVGKVGSGFNRQNLEMLFRKFKPLIRKQSPFEQSPREKDVTFLVPRLVAQVSFAEWTADRKLRQPVFLGLRDDKSAAEVTMPEVLR
jgi:bifunctional non-homologous end joining protein LigD